MEHEIPTIDVLHDKVDPSGGLEAGMKADKEGVSLPVGGLEDTLLGASGFHLIILKDELLLEDFDGIEVPSGLFLGKEDLTKVPLTQDADEVKVIQGLVGEGLGGGRGGCGRAHGRSLAPGHPRGRDSIGHDRNSHSLVMGGGGRGDGGGPIATGGPWHGEGGIGLTRPKLRGMGGSGGGGGSGGSLHLGTLFPLLGTTFSGTDLTEHLVGHLHGHTTKVGDQGGTGFVTGEATLTTPTGGTTVLGPAQGEHETTVTAPIGGEVGEGLETMGNTMVQLSLLLILLGFSILVRGGDTGDAPGDDLGVAPFVASETTILTRIT